MIPGEFSGGCACGRIRYTHRGKPLVMAECHCRDCQRATGGAYASVLLVRRAALEVRGEPKGFVTPSAQGNDVTRTFCPDCGSPLFGQSAAAPDFIAVKAGSLDDPAWFKPTTCIWTSSAQPWSRLDPELAHFEREPPRAKR
jgi:hypothetical protein